MANRAGLRKVVKTVRGKHGAVRRSYWVRAQEAGKSLIRKHGGKIAAGALLVASAIGASNAMQNLAHHTTGRAQRNRNSEFQNAQAASMTWGGRSGGIQANFTRSANHGFSGDTLHVGGNIGSSLSATHAAQYNSSHHVNAVRNGDGFTMGVGPAVRAYGPVPRRAGPIARRFGS